MRAELPSWPDTCQRVAAQLDELIVTLSAPQRAINRRQELGRSLVVNSLRRARHILDAAADPAWTGIGARADEVGEWLEQGEYHDPDDLDWPER